MCDNHGDPFIAMFKNVLLAPYLCDITFSIIMLMNSGHTCLFPKGFYTVYFGAKEKNAVTSPHSAQRKHEFWEEIKEISKTKELPSRKKIALELLHQRFGHRSHRSFLDGDTASFWEDIELRINKDPFCKSCQIYSINEKAGSKILLEPKAPFRWVLLDIFPSTAPKFLTSDTDFSYFLLIVDTCSNIPKFYGMEKIATEEVIDKLDMFQSIFRKIDEFGWWGL